MRVIFHTKYLLIICIPLIIYFLLPSRKKYWNVFSGGCYLEDQNSIIFLFGINKKREMPLHGSIPHQLSLSDAKQMLYIIDIDFTGKISSKNYILNTPMSGFTTADGVSMLKIKNDIFVFDYFDNYKLTKNDITHFDISENYEMGKIISEYKAIDNYNVLFDWKEQHKHFVICSNEINELSMGNQEQMINLNNKNILIKRCDENKDYITISISCSGILDNPILLIIPKEIKTSYITPNFIELPYIVNFYKFRH